MSMPCREQWGAGGDADGETDGDASRCTCIKGRMQMVLNGTLDTEKQAKHSKYSQVRFAADSGLTSSDISVALLTGPAA
eukprot:1160088-Pelagomonas_calceolata.AAC.12